MFSKIESQIAAAISAILMLITIGTVSFHYLEDWSFIKSFYFSVITLTTVGYGDLYPTTDASRLFTALYILLGVAVVLASLAIIGSRYLEIRENTFKKRWKK